MRILELYDTDGPHGVARMASTIAGELRYRGHEVVKMRAGADDPTRSLIGEPSCVGGGPLTDRRLVAEIRRLNKTFDFDVVHAHHRRLGLLATLATRGTRSRVVEHVHSVFDDKRWSSFRADTIVALTSGLKAQIERRYPHARGRVRVCPNGVEIQDHVPQPCHRSPPILLGVGRLELAKDPAEFCRLVQALNDKGFPARGIWLGDGPLADELKTNYGELCSFPGVVESTLGWVRKASSVVSASRREGLPLSLLEGMASGRPILAKPAGGVPELLSSGEGLLWRWDEDATEFASRVGPFLNDSEAMAAAGAAALKTVEGNYSISRMMDRLTTIFNQVAV